MAVLRAWCSVLGAVVLGCWALEAESGKPGAESSKLEAAADIHGADALVKVYDAILDARFDQAAAELQKACPPAPKEACDVLAPHETHPGLLQRIVDELPQHGRAGCLSRPAGVADDGHHRGPLSALADQLVESEGEGLQVVAGVAVPGGN